MPDVAHYESPIGVMEITGTPEGILSVNFIEEAKTIFSVPDCLQECVAQIEEYFKGNRTEFSLALVMKGTKFQEKVWEQLKQIPYGATASYMDIACLVGNKLAVRAVGGANHENKIGLIIPCHRVIGQHGALTGYAGGVWRKEWLLNHEKRVR